MKSELTLDWFGCPNRSSKGQTRIDVCIGRFIECKTKKMRPNCVKCDHLKSLVKGLIMEVL